MDKQLIGLITCAIEFLLLLIKRYEEGGLDYQTFENLAKTKVILLKNFINDINSKELVLLGNVIVQKCNDIKKFKKIENAIY